MKINLEWLNEYLDQPLAVTESDISDLVEEIERTSVEVDDYKTLADKQDGLIVAEVMSIATHPDSDHMVITQLDIGQSQQVQVVTGAPNVAVGQFVILAQVGAHIINHESGELIELSQVKLRGIESNGMLVALQEIGFDAKIAPKDFEAGIFVFNPEDIKDVSAGDDALAVLGMHDIVVDTDLTPNRADMLSMIGTAYEFGAMRHVTVTEPDFDLIEYETLAADQINVVIDEPSLVSKYAVRVMNNVTVQDSPLWLQKRLWNAGMRPINNIVDITNYMMLMYGQPIHAFDLDKLTGQTLHVRRAGEDEILTTLDGNERHLRSGEDIVIADDQRALMLAGVMGGMSSEVDANTKNIVIESAIFNSTLVRATARRHNLHSEASSRFERGVNSDNTFNTLDHAAALVDQLAQGQVAKGRVVAVDKQPPIIKIQLTSQRVNQLLGTQLTLADIATIFDRLAFTYENNGTALIVTVPARRPDISIEADLIEEVARLFGYDNLPVTLPVGPTTPGKLSHRQRKMRATRQIFESLGLNQAISYVLTTAEKAQKFTLAQKRPTVSLSYPMSSDRTTARQNILSGLLDDVAYNVAHSVHDIALYEQGRVFFAKNENELPQEVEHVAGVLVGELAESHWQKEKAERIVDFYDIKGIVAQYLDEIGISEKSIRYVATDQYPDMHPGQTADIYAGDIHLGFVGQIHPSILKAQKLPRVFGFELNLEHVFSNIDEDILYQKISRFPQVSRDIALLVDDNISNATIESVIWDTAYSKLVDVTLFDLYTGENLSEGKRSLAYTLTYQDDDETLVETDVNTDFEKVKQALVSGLGAEIR